MAKKKWHKVSDTKSKFLSYNQQWVRVLNGEVTSRKLMFCNNCGYEEIVGLEAADVLCWRCTHLLVTGQLRRKRGKTHWDGLVEVK